MNLLRLGPSAEGYTKVLERYKRGGPLFFMIKDFMVYKKWRGAKPLAVNLKHSVSCRSEGGLVLLSREPNNPFPNFHSLRSRGFCRNRSFLAPHLESEASRGDRELGN